VAYLCRSDRSRATAILRPLRQQPPEGAPAKDVEIYKQQLQEIAEERGSGLLGEAEAQAAQSRFRAVSWPPPRGPQAKGQHARDIAGAVSFAVVGALAVISVGAYLIFGSPELRDNRTSAAPRRKTRCRPSLSALSGR